MKKMMVAALVGASMLGAGSFSSMAFAQASATSAKPAAKKSAKPVARKAAAKHETRGDRRRPRRNLLDKTPAVAAIPAGAERWSCADAKSVYIAGDMKRDQILTVSYDGRNYKLPRETTTTGADRFYDPASGIDLVVIPTKAMLFDDKGDRTRLADECVTKMMAEQNTPAPTQANELLKGKN